MTDHRIAARFVREHARPLVETFTLGALLYAFIALGLAL